MNYRHRLINQTLALLPVHLSICYAAYAAHVAHVASKTLARPSGAFSSSTNTVAASKPCAGSLTP